MTMTEQDHDVRRVVPFDEVLTVVHLIEARHWDNVPLALATPVEWRWTGSGWRPFRGRGPREAYTRCGRSIIGSPWVKWPTTDPLPVCEACAGVEHEQGALL